MLDINHILVVLDSDHPEQHALDRALSLACSMKADITILGSCYEAYCEESSSLEIETKHQIKSALINNCQLWLDSFVKEAEENAETDKAKRSSVETRNAGESAVFQAEKILKDENDKIPDDIKSDVEAKVEAVKESLADEDADTTVIAAVTEELQAALQAVGQAVYEANQTGGGEEATVEGGDQADDNDAAADSDDDEDTVEGEFREV